MRLLCVGLQLLWFGESLPSLLDKLAAPGFPRPQMIIQGLLFALPEELLRSMVWVVGLHWLTLAAGIFAFIGMGTRFAMPAFAVGTILQVAWLYSYGEHHHPEAAFCLFLMMMAFAPCGQALSVDAWLARRRGGSPTTWGPQATTEFAMWPIRTIQIFLALVYFDSFLSKVIVGGSHWINGYTLQTYLLQDGIRWDRPLGVWMAQSRPMGIAMAVGALAFEGLFFLILLPRFRRLTPVFLIVGTMMHMTIWLAQAAPFFQFLVLYLTWVPWERWWPTGAGSRDVAAIGNGLRVSMPERNEATGVAAKTRTATSAPAASVGRRHRAS